MNARLLLERLFAEGPASRADLARASGLSKPTVSAALADLAAGGLVRLVGAVEGRPGPAATLYDADARAGLAVGVDIGRQLLRVAVADLRGNVLAREDAPNVARSAGDLVRRIDGLARGAAAGAGLPWAEVVRVVLASPGVPNPDAGRLRFADNLPGWGQPGLLDRLRATLAVPLSVENDINLAALAEHAEGVARGCRHFVLLSIGTGLGMGIVVDGRLYSGASGAAGEVAFLPPDGIEPTPRARTPRRDRLGHGLAEDLLSARAAVAAARAVGLEVGSARRLFEAAAGGDARARRVVRLLGGRLGAVVASIAAVLDPELVVLSGGVGQNLPLLRPAMEARLHRLTPLRPRVLVSALPGVGVLRGALTVATRGARELLFERWLAGGRPGAATPGA